MIVILKCCNWGKYPIKSVLDFSLITHHMYDFMACVGSEIFQAGCGCEDVLWARSPNPSIKKDIVQGLIQTIGQNSKS